MIRSRPGLRIVAQEVWDAAQALLNRLSDAYGMKAGQNSRGPRVHHTSIYPSSLLSGLLICGECGAKLVCECGGPRKYFAFTNHRKGLCSMTYRAPQSLTEKVLLDFLCKILSDWPEWMAQTFAALQKTVADAAKQVPATVVTDERHLAKVQKQLERLVDALASGSQQSQAIMTRVRQLESESGTLQKRIANARKLLTQSIDLPDEARLRSQMQNLNEVLSGEPGQAALLLLAIIGKITINAVVVPGKMRGYGRMFFNLSGGAVIQKLATSVPASLMPPNGGSPSSEIQLDLGSPTRCDRWTPEIDTMRKAGIGWRQISRVTEISSGNAHIVWKRWLEAQAGSA